MPPRLARLLAAVVAIALIAGAFAVRGALSGDEDDGGDDRPGVTRSPDGDDYRIVCDADLGEDACAAVADATGVEVETMTWAQVRDADDLASYDAWLTLDPLPAVLDASRTFNGAATATTGTPEPVASSMLAVLTFDESPLDCLEPIAWACLVEPVRPRLAVPTLDSSLGIIVAAAGSAGVVGNDDFSITSFRDTEDADLVRELVGRSPREAGETAADQADAMLRPGTASAAITIAGLADRRATTVQGRNRGLRTATLFPPVAVGVVLAGLGSEGDAAVRALSEAVSGQTVLLALAEGGWANPAGASNPLPDADLIYALQEDLGS